MILTKWQAEAAYSAICAISAVGGTVRIEIEPAKTADKLTVSMCGGSIFVFKYKELGDVIAGSEGYSDLYEFATAYDLQH